MNVRSTRSNILCNQDYVYKIDLGTSSSKLSVIFLFPFPPAIATLSPHLKITPRNPPKIVVPLPTNF